MSTHDSDRNRPDAEPRVAALSDMGDFQIADGYPDPRGWHVLASDGTEIGKVHDLIVDTGAMRTRYLDVRLDPKHLPMVEGMKNEERDVLVPIGAAQLARDDDSVTLPSITPAQMATMPAFTHGKLTRDYENSVLATMPAAGAAATGSAAAATAADMASRDYYASEHFDDRRFWDRGTHRDAARADAKIADARADAKATEMKADAKATEAEADARAKEAKARADADAARMKGEATAAAERPRTLADQSARPGDVTVDRRPVQSADTAQTAVPAGETEVRIPFGDQEIIVRKRAAEPPPREHGTDQTAP